MYFLLHFLQGSIQYYSLIKKGGPIQFSGFSLGYKNFESNFLNMVKLVRGKI